MFEVSQLLLGHKCMYRQSVNTAQTRMSEEQFFVRLGSLPIVNSAWTNALDVYQKTKNHNVLFRTSLNIAEAGVWTMMGTAKPIVGKCQPQIERVNTIACEQLAKLEEKYPAITRPTDQLVQESKEACVALVQPAIDRVSTMKQYGSDKYNGAVSAGKDQVNRVKQLGTDTITGMKTYSHGLVIKSLETTYGQLVLTGVDGLLTISESYVDKYLPSDEEHSEDEKKEVDELTTNPIDRAMTLTSKVRRRMYKKTLRELRTARVRSQETLAKLNFTVDLIDYAKLNIDQVKSRVEGTMTAAQDKVKDTWTKIMSEEEEGFEPETTEEKTIALARRLTRQIRNNVGMVASYISSTPEHIRERLIQAEKYAEDLYTVFVKKNRFEDFPSWMIVQTRERISYIQDALGYVTDFVMTSPLNWLVPKSRVEVIEMSSMNEGHRKD
ncbi:perilipin-2-like isoform X2 [Gigantopelta aegis]|uniref:perilipin-2-like isoform X2 n=1 Tax=Gigantopelta aegis TaxID=1735272 RepID=UPI001B88DFB4|nr:perilipin-2-like isoform X2 [Gigantopelta aegis]